MTRALAFAAVPALLALAALLLSDPGGLAWMRAASLGAFAFACAAALFTAAPAWGGGLRRAWSLPLGLLLLLTLPLLFSAPLASVGPHLVVLLAHGALGAGFGWLIQQLELPPELAAGAAGIVVTVAMTALWWADDVATWFPGADKARVVTEIWAWDPALVISYGVFGHDRLHDADVYASVASASSAIPQPGLMGLVLRLGGMAAFLLVCGMLVRLCRRWSHRRAAA